MWPFKKSKKKPSTVPDPRAKALTAASLQGKLGSWRPQHETLLGELRSGNLSLVRKRCRESSVNSPTIASLVAEIKSQVVGSGVTIEFTHPTDRHKKMANELWEAWVESRDFSSDGELNFYQMQKLVMSEVAKAGEIFIKKNIKDGVMNPAKEVGLEYQIFPADQLADRIAFGTPNVDVPEDIAENSKFIDGIGYNAKGRKVGFIFYEDDYSRRSLFSYHSFNQAQTKYVPADEIHHIYHRIEARYRRGWPLVATAIVYGHLSKLLDESQLSKQVIAAMFAAFIHDNSAEVGLENLGNADAGKDDFDYNESLEGGTMYDLPPGKDVTFSDAPQNNDYESFDTAITRKISSSAGMPYESVAGNHSDANYSAARQSQLSSDRRAAPLRDDILIEQFIIPVINDFKKYLSSMAILPVEGLGHNIFRPGKILIDPAKEVKPKAQEVRSGFKSWSEAVREMGKNPRKVAEMIQKDIELFDELGIKVDTDIRNDNPPEGKPNAEGNSSTTQNS